MGRAALDKLGERICNSSAPSPEDLERLAQFTDEHLEALEQADAIMRQRLGITSGSIVAGTEITASNRLKRDRRIREKLERDTKLSRVQDIVGFRIVGQFTLTLQTELAERIRAEFAGKLIDRRAFPNYGYRAVHVVASVDGYWLEIQIRTFLQDYWANGMEALSRRWGRQIQYGEPPDYKDMRMLIRRTEAMGQYQALGDQIMEVETRLDRYRLRRPSLGTEATPAERLHLERSLRVFRSNYTRAIKQFQIQVDRFLDLVADD